MKTIGPIVILPLKMKGIDAKKYNLKLIGSYEDVVKNGLFDYIIPNHYIDYMDLTKTIVSPVESFKSWCVKHEIATDSIFLTFSNFNGITQVITKLPKTAQKEPHFDMFFTVIDDSNPDLRYICNKYGVPIIKDGYRYYNLDNFNIKEDVYYCTVRSDENYDLKCTDIDINVMNINGSNKKQYLYNMINKKKLIVLT